VNLNQHICRCRVREADAVNGAISPHVQTGLYSSPRVPQRRCQRSVGFKVFGEVDRHIGPREHVESASDDLPGFFVQPENRPDRHRELVLDPRPLGADVSDVE
jgi:hypothetical protein